MLLVLIFGLPLVKVRSGIGVVTAFLPLADILIIFFFFFFFFGKVTEIKTNAQ